MVIRGTVGAKEERKKCKMKLWVEKKINKKEDDNTLFRQKECEVKDEMKKKAMKNK